MLSKVLDLSCMLWFELLFSIVCVNFIRNSLYNYCFLLFSTKCLSGRYDFLDIYCKYLAKMLVSFWGLQGYLDLTFIRSKQFMHYYTFLTLTNVIYALHSLLHRVRSSIT